MRNRACTVANAFGASTMPYSQSSDAEPFDGRVAVEVFGATVVFDTAADTHAHAQQIVDR